MRGNIKKSIAAFVSCAAVVSAASGPTAFAEAPAVDYELVGVWCETESGEIAEFCADGIVYGFTEGTVEDYYQRKNSAEGLGIIFEYTADGEYIEIIGMQCYYEITGGRMYANMDDTYEYTFERVFDYGDVDSDGGINALDASAVLSEYAASATGGASTLEFIQTKAADVNCDGAVDALDASEILGYYAYTATGGAGCFIEFYFA